MTGPLVDCLSAARRLWGSLLGALTGTSRKPVASANFRDIGVGEGSSSRKKECLHQQLSLVPAA